MYTDHTYCRACGLGKPEIPTLKVSAAAGPQVGPSKLITVFSLGVQPLANDFCHSGEPHAGYAPLDVLLCPRCHLAQLSVVVEPGVLYSHYAYETSKSDTMRAHFETMAGDIASLCTPCSVLEIGSNDGLLLEFLKKRWGLVDNGVLGIEPATNLAEISRARGIPTNNDFFGPECMGLAELTSCPDVIIARHVLCHCDDWHDFVKGLEKASGRHTVIFIETPYVQDLLDKTEFDTIYHEHLSYLSIASVVALLKDTSLELHQVIRYTIHGGAVGLILRRRDCGKPPHESVQMFLDAEDVGERRWKTFSDNEATLVCDLMNTVRVKLKEGRVAALGASAKSTVWLNVTRGDRTAISFVADCTKAKWNTTIPGTDIPVVDEGAILRELPDYVVCFAWNFRDEILAKNSPAREKGVRFIFPVPKVEIV